MKKILISLLALIAISASAQNLVVKYDYTYTSLRDGVKKEIAKRTLVSDGTRSMFYDTEAWAVDSLKSTPEGKEALRQQALAAIAGSQSTQSNGVYISTNSDGNRIQLSVKGDYICKNSDGTITSYYNDNLDKSLVTEPLGGIDWQLTDSVKTVLGYECQLAEADYHGRHWSAWFTTDIPAQEGPWKLCGLPGLILEAEADGGVYGFAATQVGTTDGKIPVIYGKEEYEKIKRLDYWKGKRDYTDNAGQKIEASLGLSIKFEDGTTLKGLFVPRKVMDFIETDY